MVLGAAADLCVPEGRAEIQERRLPGGRILLYLRNTLKMIPAVCRCRGVVGESPGLALATPPAPSVGKEEPRAY